jgi:hypothetical protein
MTWDKEKVLTWLGIDEDDDDEPVFIRKLPKCLVDELRGIDDRLRPDREFNLPLWIRISLIHFIEDYKGINRDIILDEYEDDEYED